MKKKIIALLSAGLMMTMLFSACESSTTTDEGTTDTTQTQEITGEDAQETASTETAEGVLADGVYTAEFHTDSSMFHINEAYDGKGTLTVEDGQMTIHVTLVSKNIVNLYLGTAEEAKQDGAVLINPTEDQVTYSDGWTETVYGFDVPVAALDEEFDLALIGTKGTWYDHKVSVSNPVPIE